METGNIISEMRKIKVFDDLKNAPFGAIVVYELKYVDSNGKENNTVLVAFDDGNGEVVWSAGIDLFDALKMASREYSYYFANTFMEKENPFQEVLDDLSQN